MYVCMYMCMYACVCMYVCMCVCVCIFVFMFEYRYEYVCMYVCIFVFMCVCVCMYVCICVYVCMFLCVCVFMYISVYVCVYVYVFLCMYICMYVVCVCMFFLLNAPLLGVILHAYIKYTGVINNIDTIIFTLPVVFTGSLTDIYNLLLYVSCFVLFCMLWGWVILLGHKCVVCVKVVRRYLICKSGECLIVLGYEFVFVCGPVVRP